MTLKQYILLMSIATFLCFAAWGVVVFNIDPVKDSSVGIVFFYITLFFALVGAISIINFGLYRLITKSDYPLFRLVQKSFRNGVLGSALLISMLVLQAMNILNIWTGIILLILFLSISFFKLSTRAHEKH